jgi:hypothetical protein
LSSGWGSFLAVFAIQRKSWSRSRDAHLVSLLDRVHIRGILVSESEPRLIRVVGFPRKGRREPPFSTYGYSSTKPMGWARLAAVQNIGWSLR